MKLLDNLEEHIEEMVQSIVFEQVHKSTDIVLWNHVRDCVKTVPRYNEPVEIALEETINTGLDKVK